MDNLRGQFPDQTGAEAQQSDEDLGEDETGGELPPAAIGQDERRMQVRAYNFWASLLQDRNLPPIESLAPAELPDFGPHSVLLDFSDGVGDPVIRFLGAELAVECDAPGELSRLSDVPGRSLLSRITDHYMQIIANQAPIGFEAEFVNQRGATILYRGILLPFSSDDATIDFIYGVINWKELADQHTTDELMLQIDQVLEPKSGDRDETPLTEWADGPVDNGGVHDLLVLETRDEHGTGLPQPAFGRRAPALPPMDEATQPISEQAAGQMALSDWLASARDLAHFARGCEDRSREALYAALSRAFDFSLAAMDAPEEFERIVADAGVEMQDRAPMTPVVKLVFGTEYDKTRLAEYAAALSHAHRLGLDRGTLAGFLAGSPGGLKGVVASERALRRGQDGAPARHRDAPRKAIAAGLRGLEPVSLSDISDQGSEFTLLVARRLPSGEVVVLGEIGQDVPLLERAAKHLLA